MDRISVCNDKLMAGNIDYAVLWMGVFRKQQTYFIKIKVMPKNRSKSTPVFLFGNNKMLNNKEKTHRFLCS